MEKLCCKCRLPTQETLSLLDLPKLEISPRLTHLLQSNVVPLDSDIPFIRNIVSGGQDRVDALNDQIHSLQDTLAQLICARDEAAEHVRQHRAVISPVRRVPPELLCEIFALAWHEDVEETARVPPWHLGHICRSWRDAALLTTSLWSSVSASSENSRSLAMMKTQLARSGNAPLSVFWSCNEFSDPRCLKLLVAQCSRWCILRLDCRLEKEAPAENQSYFDDEDTDDEDVSTTLLDWLRPAAGHLARLQKLGLVTEDPGLMVPELFLSAPALREVIFTDQTYSVSPSLSSLPWAQVTHYRGTYEMNQQMTILEAAAQSLVECSIGLKGSPSAPYRQDIITAPRLRRLCLWNSIFLDHLIAPSLEALSSLRTQNLRQLLSFVQRSSCKLTKLILMRCHHSSSDLIALFEGLPALTYLFIASPAHFQQSHVFLFDALSTSRACPNLTSLLYGYNPTGGEDDKSFAWDAFFAIAQYRLQRPCRLKYLRLVHTAESPTHPRADIEARLKTLREKGLDAAFMSYYEFERLKGRGDFF
ncbi:hypothetical protein DFH06DRAFT_1225229 [Mycena polygramma]|nr:hypothetical protein DFH06DRAFT_1225229 [Mycena polygramma]